MCICGCLGEAGAVILWLWTHHKQSPEEAANNPSISQHKCSGHVMIQRQDIGNLPTRADNATTSTNLSNLAFTQVHIVKNTHADFWLAGTPVYFATSMYSGNELTTRTEHV